MKSKTAAKLKHKSTNNNYLSKEIEAPDGASLERKRRQTSVNKELKRKLRAMNDSCDSAEYPPAVLMDSGPDRRLQQT